MEALRSGEYKQTGGVLRDERGFCCLGVLCELYAKENNLKWEEDIFSYDGSKRLVFRLKGTDVKTHLPYHVTVWAGLVDDSGTPMTSPLVKLEGRIFPVSLAGLNDGGATFTEIADVIEKCL